MLESVKLYSSPKSAANTVAMAAASVEWPEGYSGKGGVIKGSVTAVAFQVGSMTLRI